MNSLKDTVLARYVLRSFILIVTTDCICDQWHPVRCCFNAILDVHFQPKRWSTGLQELSTSCYMHSQAPLCWCRSSTFCRDCQPVNCDPEPVPHAQSSWILPGEFQFLGFRFRWDPWLEAHVALSDPCLATYCRCNHTRFNDIPLPISATSSLALGTALTPRALRL